MIAGISLPPCAGHMCLCVKIRRLQVTHVAYGSVEVVPWVWSGFALAEYGMDSIYITQTCQLASMRFRDGLVTSTPRSDRKRGRHVFKQDDSRSHSTIPISVPVIVPDSACVYAHLGQESKHLPTMAIGEGSG